ncbi:MAG: 5'/3'-nucleotidase SurE [Deltaproteobacteria bacterium]|nr:5'/3'-nucleotidase SurE [Deltaproteobacteria bacterium]
MRILLTNDDGIHAPGLFALHEALKSDHDLDIVAPESEMSAVGHAITLTSPLRVQDVYKNSSFYGYAVTGTPADCVKIAVQELLENILYSGTVSAATEGAFLGVPSAAISLNKRQNPDFGFAAQFSKEIIRFMMESGLKSGTALSVNIPAVSPDRITGVRLTRQGTARFEEHFERRTDPRGNVYYWLTGETPVENGSVDTDSGALKENWITITPIHYNLTCNEELDRLKSRLPDSWVDSKREF